MLHTYHPIIRIGFDIGDFQSQHRCHLNTTTFHQKKNSAPFLLTISGLGRPLPFNRSVGMVYNSREWEIGAAPVDCRAALETALNAGDTASVAALLHPEGELKHPCLEVYKQVTVDRPAGDVLLFLMQTRRVDANTVKRYLAGRWEASPDEIQRITARQAGMPDHQPE
jgi:hypothetical protein